MNVNLENLTKMHGDKAVEVMREIADLGGFGSIGDGVGQINPLTAGGLDVHGVIFNQNPAISEKSKDRIAELSGISRKSADEYKGTSSAHKMKSGNV